MEEQPVEFISESLRDYIAENNDKKQNKVSNSSVERLVCELPPGFAGHDVPHKGQVSVGGFELPYEIRLVKLKRTEEEKKAIRRIYTKNYLSRPHVKEKIAKRLNDPDNVKARKEYASKPEVKERKRELNKRNRAIRNVLKQQKPEIYREIVESVIEHGG